MGLTPREICDSKVKHTLLAAEYLANQTENGISQDYYKCSVCKQII